VGNTIVVAAVLLAAVSARAATSVACSWTGTWKTDRGTMQLVQSGDLQSGANVTGTVSMVSATAQGMVGGLSFTKGFIEAVAMGDKLSGTWKKPPRYGPPSDAGDIEFTLAVDCNSFTGNWRHGYGSGQSKTWEGKWNGTRVGAMQPPPAQPVKRSACASAKPSITGGSEFKAATFTIDGPQPQKVRITQGAENFGIKEEYGRVVYQVIDGKSWGSLTLEPGTYILSCGGGGAMGLMSASVCVEYLAGNPTASPGTPVAPPSTGPGKPGDPGGGGGGSSPPPGQVVLPKGPAVDLVVRARGDAADTLIMRAGEMRNFAVAWAEDAFGNKIGGINAEEWSVDHSQRGSIDKKTGKFKAGPKEGAVTIKATARNKDGDTIDGTFPVTVANGPRVRFVGTVKLFDQNMKPVSPAGSRMRLEVGMYKSLEHWNKNISEPDAISWWTANRKGTFRAEVPVKSGIIPINYSAEVFAPSRRLNPGHVWSVLKTWDDEDFSPNPLSTNSIVYLKPRSGLPHFRWVMRKADTIITGRVTHRGKPHESVKVRLLRRGQEVDYCWSTGGRYTLYVDDLPAGRYLLTAEHRPKEFGNHTTIHNWLKIKKDIEVDLPPKQQKTVIDIEVLSWGDKIGYTGP